MNDRTNTSTDNDFTLACAVIDGPRGQSDYNDLPREYPSSAELISQNADIIALARFKSTTLPDCQDDTYEYLLEEAYLAGADFAKLSRLAALGLNLEALRIAFATTHDFDRALALAATQIKKAPTLTVH